LLVHTSYNDQTDGGTVHYLVSDYFMVAQHALGRLKTPFCTRRSEVTVCIMLLDVSHDSE